MITLNKLAYVKKEGLQFNKKKRFTDLRRSFMFHVGENSYERTQAEKTHAWSSHLKLSYRALNMIVCNNLSDTM